MILTVVRQDVRNALLPFRLARHQGLAGFWTGLKQGWPASLFSLPLALVLLQTSLILAWLAFALATGAIYA